jgi:large subunit ribosomal protein L24
MAATCNIRKNDVVIAIAGAEAGARKTGKVLQVFPERGRVLVEGMRFVTKTLRKSQERPQGAIIRKEAPLAISNVMLFCPQCKKGVRVNRARDAKGRPVRTCRRCRHAFD